MKKTYILTLLLSATLLTACGAQGQSADLTDELTPQSHAAETPASSQMTLEDGAYEVNLNTSKLHWEAFKLTSSHEGNLLLREGSVTVKNGLPVSGSFVVDMNSITCTDIQDEASATALVEYLKNEDFFAVGQHPETRFEITGASYFNEAGDYDYEIQGNLTLRGITQPVILLAKVNETDPLKVHATAKIDRTRFDVTFNSGSLVA